MAAQTRELVLELGDPQRLRLDERDQTLGGCPQLGRIFGQRLALIEHDHG